MPQCLIENIILQPPLSSPIQATFYYRYYLDEAWILIQSNVTVNIDGSITASPSVSFNIDYNTRYTLRADNEQCETVYMEDILFPCTQGCPNGYTLSPDGTYCYKILTQPATQTAGDEKLACHFTRTEYGIFGVVFYKAGYYNTNGTWDISSGSGNFPNLYNNLNLQSPPPVNINFNTLVTSPFLNVPEDTTHGRLNLAGLWLCGDVTYPGTLGFSRQIYIAEAKTYYIGVGADDYCTIKVNGETIVSQSQLLTSAANYFNNSLQNQLFRYWHMYPVSLLSGYPIIEVQGTNVSSVGILGLEIYDATEAELVACVDETALDAYLVYSTKNVTDSSPFDIGNYNCNAYPGYSLVSAGSPAEYVCQLIQTTEINCP